MGKSKTTWMGRRGVERRSKKAPISIEILAIGPQFRELDLRDLVCYIRKPEFCKHAPAI